MPRPSKLLEKLEDYVEKKCGAWYARHKAKLPLYIPLGLTAWYFYGMFLNSLALGTAATFHASGDEEVHSMRSCRHQRIFHPRRPPPLRQRHQRSVHEYAAGSEKGHPAGRERKSAEPSKKQGKNPCKRAGDRLY